MSDDQSKKGDRDRQGTQGTQGGGNVVQLFAPGHRGSEALHSVNIGPYEFGNGIWRKSGKGSKRVAAFRPHPEARIERRGTDGTTSAIRFGLYKNSIRVGEVALGTDELSSAAALRRAIVDAAPDCPIEAREGEHLLAALGHLLSHVGLATLPLETEVGSTGWHQIGGQWLYVTPSRSIGPATTRFLGEVESYSALLDFEPDMAVNEAVPLALAGPPIRMATTLRLLLVAGAFSPLISRQLSGRGVAIHVVGVTGRGKTALAETILRVYRQRGGTAAGWAGTANAVERALSVCGDQAVPVDDLKAQMVAQSGVLRLIQQHADGTQRDRLSRSAQKGRAYPPRGLLFSTGEDPIPTEASAWGRVVQVELHGGLLDALALVHDEAWASAARSTIIPYLEWLQPRLDNVVDDARRQQAAHHDALRMLAPNAAHPRMYEGMALLLGSLDPLLWFAEQATGKSYADKRTDWQRAGAEMLVQMTSEAVESRLGRRFVEAICSAAHSGRVRLKDGERVKLTASPAAPRVGYIDLDRRHLYLEPLEALRALSQLDPGAGWRTQLQESVSRALESEGYLLARDKGQRTKKLTVDGARRRVWWLDLAALLGHPTSEDATR